MLQIIAMISMLLDHMGVCIGEQSRLYSLLRCVGRLAMPIYAYFCVTGYRHIRDKWAYILRQCIIGASAQLAYICLIGKFKINICFVWALSAAWLYAWEHPKKWIKCVYTFGVIALFIVLPFDYHGFGAFAWVILFYMISDMHIICALALPLSLIGQYQIFALVAVPIIAICRKYNIERVKNKQLKYIWRWFYPLHMYLLRGAFS